MRFRFCGSRAFCHTGKIAKGPARSGGRPLIEPPGGRYQFEHLRAG
jgi:hypothetical protein